MTLSTADPRKLVLLVPLLAACLGPACSSVPEYTYFTMAYSLLPHKDGPPEPVAASLRVRDLDITPAYDKDKLVYRFSPYEFQYYNYMMWAVKPHKMVSELIIRQMDHANVFALVARDFDENRPEYELTGTLEAIEELDSGNEWYAHLAISLRMTHYRDEVVVWSHRIDAKKQVYNKAPVYVVKALSELMEVEMEKAIVSLRKFLATRKGGGGSGS